MQTQLSATPLSPELQQKYDALASNIKQLGHLAIAFSGGVDSSYLLYAAASIQRCSSKLPTTRLAKTPLPSRPARR